MTQYKKMLQRINFDSDAMGLLARIANAVEILTGEFDNTSGAITTPQHGLDYLQQWRETQTHSR
jgi:hypothetical protein